MGRWTVLAAGVVALAWCASAAAQSSPASVWDGVYTDAQAVRGETAYLQECANCHGTALEGGDMTPPLLGGGVHVELERPDGG